MELGFHKITLGGRFPKPLWGVSQSHFDVSQSHFGVPYQATLGCFPKPLWGVSQSHFGVFPKATLGAGALIASGSLSPRATRGPPRRRKCGEPPARQLRLRRFLCTYGFFIRFLSLIIAPLASYNLVIALLLPPL